jgi:hypothetical protein
MEGEEKREENVKEKGRKGKVKGKKCDKKMKTGRKRVK